MKNPSKLPNGEVLVCSCEDGGKHEQRTVENPNGEREVIVECSVCHRFLKHPA